MCYDLFVNTYIRVANIVIYLSRSVLSINTILYISMAKAKGSPKTGGRKAGTPNKTPKPLKVAIAKILEQYNESGQMEMDFNCIDPLERIKIAEKLMQYVVPKIQSVAVDVNNTDGNKTIEDRLRELSQQHDKVGK